MDKARTFCTWNVKLFFLRNLEAANGYEWMSESREIRTDSQDFKGKIVAGSEHHRNIFHLVGTW